MDSGIFFTEKSGSDHLSNQDLFYETVSILGHSMVVRHRILCKDFTFLCPMHIYIEEVSHRI